MMSLLWQILGRFLAKSWHRLRHFLGCADADSDARELPDADTEMTPRYRYRSRYRNRLLIQRIISAVEMLITGVTDLLVRGYMLLENVENGVVDV